MKISIEAKISAAVAAAFVAITIGSVVAQGSSAGQVAAPGQPGEMLGLGLHSSITQQASDTHAQQ